MIIRCYELYCKFNSKSKSNCGMCQRGDITIDSGRKCMDFDKDGNIGKQQKRSKRYCKYCGSLLSKQNVSSYCVICILNGKHKYAELNNPK